MRAFLAQSKAELRMTLRRGESVLLALGIPVLLLGFFSVVDVLPTGTDDPVTFLFPGILALAVMSTAMVSTAISTGFERQYGVLKRLGATPLPRSVLLLAKTLAVLVVELLQVTLLCLVGLALGWEPRGSVLSVVALVALGTAAFSGLGLLLGGTLRGLTTLAAANLLWFVLLVLGGVLFPVSAFGAAEPLLSLLPTAALSHGLREVLVAGVGLPLRDLAALAVWAVASLTAASRLFRWE